MGRKSDQRRVREWRREEIVRVVLRAPPLKPHRWEGDPAIRQNYTITMGTIISLRVEFHHRGWLDFLLPRRFIAHYYTSSTFCVFVRAYFFALLAVCFILLVLSPTTYMGRGQKLMDYREHHGYNPPYLSVRKKEGSGLSLEHFTDSVPPFLV